MCKLVDLHGIQLGVNSINKYVSDAAGDVIVVQMLFSLAQQWFHHYKKLSTIFGNTCSNRKWIRRGRK